MAFFSKIFKRGEEKPVFGGSSESKPEAGGQTVSSVRVGDYTPYFEGYGESLALKVAAVYRCVTLISGSVANLPVQYMRLKDGIFVEDKAGRLSYLLNVQPDNACNAFDFWSQVVVNVLLDGNAYIVPVYNQASLELDRLVLCARGSVSHDEINDRYTVSDLVNGVSGVYDENEIIHIKGFSLDGKKGISVLAYARITFGAALAADVETLKRFKNGGNVRGIISNKYSVVGMGEYQDEELKRLAESLNNVFNRDGIASLPGLLDFKQLSMSSADMQFLGLQQFNVRNVCRWFGVHPSFVFDDTSNNYKSAEMANVAFLTNTLNPILRRIEAELLRKLVAPSLAAKRKFQFDRRGLYACDLDSRVKYQAQTIAAGLYTVNEWRKEENKPPVEGGDKVFVSANLKGIDETGNPATVGNTGGKAGEDTNLQKNEEDGKE